MRSGAIKKGHDLFPSGLALLSQRYFCEATSSRSRTRPRGHWSVLEHQRQLLEQVGQALGVKQLADWYSIPRKDVVMNGGRMLFKYYGTVEKALRALYPHYLWQSLRFPVSDHAPRGFWLDGQNLNKALDAAEQILKIATPDDWYEVKMVAAREAGLPKALSRRRLGILLEEKYPDHRWKHGCPLKGLEREGLAAVPSRYWQDRTNLMQALNRAEQALGIKEVEDWYSVTLADLKAVGLPSRLNRKQLLSMLEEKCPEHNWEATYLLRAKLAQQKRLEILVRALFPEERVQANVRKEAQLVNTETGQYLELDVFLPSLKLAFEYHEKHHYSSTEYAFEPVKHYTQRDQMKKDLAKSMGITLITVPYWWDRKRESNYLYIPCASLVASVKGARPDLLQHEPTIGSPIPESIPAHMLNEQLFHVDDIGEPTTARFFTLSDVNPAGWWVFEKYDGLRGFWNPMKRAFYSRHGNRLVVPQEVIDAMPTNMFLDGEIWFGRESFQEAMKLAHRVQRLDIDWTAFKFMVFDVPVNCGTYEQRYAQLVEHFAAVPCKYVEIAPKEICKDIIHLESVFQDVIDRGGEGVILRDPQCPYQPGRSPGYLKHKKFRDAEARIVRSVGANQWECELPNGVRFTAAPATAEFARKHKLKENDIVSFKHHGYLLVSKRPKYPVLHRSRPDLLWEDVIANWKGGKSTPTVTPIRRAQRKNKPKGYWHDVANRKDFFLQFARQMGFDPNKAENWYGMNAKIVAHGGGGLLVLFGNSVPNALAHTFPELKLRGVRRWRDRNARREFFLGIAQEAGFDPSIASSWLQVTRSQVLAKKGGRRLLARYQGSLVHALAATFPQVFAGIAPGPQPERAQRRRRMVAELAQLRSAQNSAEKHKI